MALVHRLAQRVGDARAHPDHGRLLHAELHGDVVGGLEANAAYVPRQAIGILRHDLHGVGTVGLVDAHRSCRADTMAVQEDHDLPDDLLLGPGRDDPTRSHRANAIDFPQAIRLRLDDVEHLFAECAQEPLGVGRADAPDHARGKVLLDAFD